MVYFPIEMQDDSGNVLYPHTTATKTWLKDGVSVTDALGDSTEYVDYANGDEHPDLSTTLESMVSTESIYANLSAMKSAALILKEHSQNTALHKDTTYGDATTSTHGLMSGTDKTKLNGIAEGANKYTHPAYTAKTSGLYKITVDATGHVSATSAVAKSDITALGIPSSDTTYDNATSTTAGLMSSADKTKLDGLSTTISNAGSSANAYTDQKIADLINGAPTTLDTLKEIADAMATNDSVVQTLNDSVASKASTSSLNTHTGNTTVHITASERSTWNAKQGAVTLGKDTASTATPAFGGTFNAVSAVTRDTNGHVTAIDTKTVTIPSSTMAAATATAAGKAGLVPAPAMGKQSQYLRGDGTWSTPTNTTYSNATTSAAGLMSSTDKTKLDGINGAGIQIIAKGSTIAVASRVAGRLYLQITD